MKIAFFVLLFANLAWYGWTHWIAPSRAPAASAAAAGNLLLAREAEPAAAGTAAARPRDNCLSLGPFTDLTDAAQHSESNGWIGTNRSASVGSANASVNASVTFSGTDLFSAGAASSFASASGGEMASATARLWDAAFMVGGRTRVVVTMTLDGLSVAGNGGTASALASLGLWGSNGAGFMSAEAQAIDSLDFSVAYSGPTTLSVNWDNPSTSLAVANISLLTSAQVLSAVAAPVPEPTTTALWLAGLAAVAGIARRRAKAADAAEMR